MSVRDEIKSQIVGALQGARFPIESPQSLVSAFPMGAETKCQAGEVEMTVAEAGKLLRPSDFPFASADGVAEVILARAGL
ncbi:MAG: MTH865 family protein [Chloroflexota bacterium]|nr:MTH865 family protein [Chloroflexota bacterium]